MKKIVLLILVIFILLILVFVSSKPSLKTVMEYDSNEDNIYMLDFSNEVLSSNNFKLKMAPFTGYSYVIRKIYPKYNRNLKKYYTYDFRDLDEGIENFKNDYIALLRKDYLFDEIDKVYKTGIIISKVEIFSNKEALTKFLNKYPNVKYRIISHEYKSL